MAFTTEQELRLECLRICGSSPNHAEKMLAWIKGDPIVPVVQRVFVEGVHCAECDGTGRPPLTKADPLGQGPCICGDTGLAVPP